MTTTLPAENGPHLPDFADYASSGAEAGKVSASLTSLNVTKRADSCSPVLFGDVVSGKFLKSVTLVQQDVAKDDVFTVTQCAGWFVSIGRRPIQRDSDRADFVYVQQNLRIGYPERNEILLGYLYQPGVLSDSS